METPEELLLLMPVNDTHTDHLLLFLSLKKKNANKYYFIDFDVFHIRFCLNLY